MKTKVLHSYLLKAYLPPFFLTLFIGVFVFFLIHVFTYMDDIVGKGMGFWILTQFFSYSFLTFIPIAMPLAVLLSSIMTFGNLAENYELAAMKSSGLSLFKIMKPVLGFIILLSVFTFFFNNFILPEITLKSARLLWDIRQSKPTLNIKEGIYYNQLDGYSIKVGKKSKDGNTLYFSSKGHTSIGGYDIFKSAMDEEYKTFSKPKNIGYPINTTDDDMNFRISKNGKYGYIASSNSGGQGDFDIYRVTFNDVESDYSVVIGEFKLKETEHLNFSDIFISITDNINKELIGNYIPNPSNGRFVIILPPGKYQMNVEIPGYNTISKMVEIFDKSSYQAEINMILEPTK